MNREQRLRRCLLLCCHFASNLAYYRARRMIDRVLHGDFWIRADNNFIDIAVLEWCKILGDDKGAHGWVNIISEPDKFKDELFENLEIRSKDWTEYVSHLRRYRDKFLAHLDSDLTMNIPKLNKALQAARFYYRWILDCEFDEFDRKCIPVTLAEFYAERLNEAKEVYSIVSV